MNKIPIQSLENIALCLIKRDNQTKKNYYNYHDTVKELEFEIKNSSILKNNNKEEIKIITAPKNGRYTQEEMTKKFLDMKFKF